MMRRITLVALLLASILYGSVTFAAEPAKTPTGSDVRAVLHGDIALTAEQYADYQTCISQVPLESDLVRYRMAVASCKKNAKQEGYLLSPEQKQDAHDTSPGSIDPKKQMQLDRAWQDKQLTK